MSFIVPPNGLVVYCGTIVTEEGKEKKVNIDFEPFKPINTSLYLCDNKFHTEVRSLLLLAGLTVVKVKAGLCWNFARLAGTILGVFGSAVCRTAGFN